jgi:hypothetical protein
LNHAPRLYLDRGHPEEAESYANEAFVAAAAIQRHNEVAIADALLARVSANRDLPAAERAFRCLVEQVGDSDRLNARARAAVNDTATVVLAGPNRGSKTPTEG